MPTERIGLPIAGIDDREALMLQDGFASALQNVRFYRNNINRRGGWKRFDNSLAAPNIPSGRTFTMAMLGDVGRFLLYDDDKVWMYGSGVWTPFTRTTPSIPGPTIYERFGVVNMLGDEYSISPGTPLSIFDGTTYQELTTDLGDNLSLDTILMRGLGLLLFNNHLIIVRPCVDGMWFPSSIKWSANGEPTKWNIELNDSAGSLPVVEQSELPLTCGFMLAGRAYVAQEKNIHEIIATGSLSPIFKTEPRVVGKGIIATDSWAAAETFGFFLGADDVYMFDGSRVEPVGKPIRDSIFADIAGEFFGADATGSARNIHAVINTKRTEYHLYLGAGDTRRVYIFDYNNNRWYKDFIQIAPQTFGLYEPGSTGSGQGLPQLVYVSEEQGTFYQDETFVESDANILNEALPIDSYIETKEYYAKEFQTGMPQPIPSMGKVNILQAVQVQSEVEASIEMGASTDGGVTWIVKNITVNRRGIGWTFFNNAFQTIRFRFRSKSTHRLFLRGFIAYSWQLGGVITK